MKRSNVEVMFINETKKKHRIILYTIFINDYGLFRYNYSMVSINSSIFAPHSFSYGIKAVKVFCRGGKA